MSRNDDKNGGDNASMGDDKERFGTLFREELDVQEKGAQGPAPPGTDAEAREATKEDPESPVQDEPFETAALSTAERRIIKIKPGLDAENDKRVKDARAKLRQWMVQVEDSALHAFDHRDEPDVLEEYVQDYREHAAKEVEALKPYEKEQGYHF